MPSPRAKLHHNCCFTGVKPAAVQFTDDYRKYLILRSAYGGNQLKSVFLPAVSFSQSQFRNVRLYSF